MSNNREKIIQTKILLESIHTNSGRLSNDKERLFYAEVMKNNNSKFRETQNAWDDKY